MTNPIRHLSASSVQNFINCPAAWYCKAVLNLPEVTPPALMAAAGQGRAVHAAISAYHLGRDPEDHLVKQWLHEVPESVQNLVHLSTGLSLVRAYVQGVSPRPADRADVKFTLEVPGVPVPLIGYLDVLSGSHVREVKTTSSQKSWSQQDCDTAIQAGVYWAAMLDSGIRRPKLSYAVLRSSGDPILTIVETTRSRADLQQLARTIRGVYAEMMAAVDSGGNGLTAGCKSAAWCRFPKICSERFGLVRPDRRDPVASMRSAIVIK